MRELFFSRSFLTFVVAALPPECVGESTTANLYQIYRTKTVGRTTTSSEALSYQGLTATIFPDSRQPSSKCSITWFLIQQPIFLVVCLPRKENHPVKFLSLWTDKPADETSSEDFSTQPASPTLRSGTGNTPARRNLQGCHMHMK